VNDVAEIESKITAFAREPHGGLICPSDTGAPDLFPQQPLWPTVVAGARYRLWKRRFSGIFTIAA
jgi:hypothetical protein